MKGVKYTTREKYRAIQMLNQFSAVIVARKMKCNLSTLWRWRNRYDGTIESLISKSSRPHTKHPQTHTEQETSNIISVFVQNPNLSYSEAYGLLRKNCSYSRTYFGFYRYIVKNNLRPREVEDRKPYIPQPYDTPLMLGKKMQMDVKFVPRECNKGEFKREWCYQYTIIDEATRERFLYPYKEHSGFSTVDFLKRAISHFGYFPEIIQTDNGTEFTNPKGTGTGKAHIVDKFMNKYGIKHQLIRPYTPRHNGKVERSHRTDQECFYDTLTFSDFEDLERQMTEWCNRYNNRPHSSLRDKDGKRCWQTPLQKREELIESLKEQNKINTVRFLKK